MPSKAETILLGVRNDSVVKLGLPPRNSMDRYNVRALDRGKIYNIRHILCSPNGEVYCVRGSDLYAGPLPSSKTSDWFSEAKRVGQQEWERFKLLCFNPKGELYAVTHEGDLYKGPKPVNENRAWMYEHGDIIGRGGWNTFEAMFFDPEGSLYVVTNYNTLLKGPAPETTYSWLQSSKTIGQDYWCRLTHFMSITPDGKLWCVDKHNGNMYRGNPPTSLDKSYMDYAEYLGWRYHEYKFCFSQDKTIKNIISFEFQPEKGEKSSENLEVITEKIYDNRKSSSPLKHTFTFEKKIIESSNFTHEHGFTFEAGVESTVKGGIPYIGEAETKVSVNTSTSHNWQFSKTNEKEITVSTSADVEIEPGKAVRMKASMMTAQINCPYEAIVETLFGNRTCIQGTWKGSSHYNLRVTQEDFEG